MTSPQQPHVWQIDADGEPKEFDSGDYHGGPRCVLCGDMFCRGCDVAGMNGECRPDPDEQEGLPEQLRYWAQAYGKQAAELNEARQQLREAAGILRGKERELASALRLASAETARRKGVEYSVAGIELQLAECREKLTHLANPEDVP